MGMSASQARLLSITARMTANELNAQFITNAKLRLADDSSEASSAYIAALSQEQLTYVSYDSVGNKTTESLTAGCLMNYGELKNQYVLVNSSGQALVSSDDIGNYEASDNLTTFLDYYGVDMTANSAYPTALNGIFGKYYDDYTSDITTDDNASDYIMDNYVSSLNSNANSWFDSMDTSNSTAFNSWASGMSNTDSTGWMDTYLAGYGASIPEGILGNYIETLQEVPTWDFGDMPVKPEDADFSTLSANYTSSRCYGSVAATTTGLQHMDHNLCALIWGTDGIGINDDGTASLTNSDGSITITKTNTSSSDTSLTSTSVGTTTTTTDLLQAFEDYGDYTCVQEAITMLTDLYCELAYKLDGETGGSYPYDTSEYSLTGTGTEESETDLFAEWEAFYAKLDTLDAEINAEMYVDYEAELAVWQEEYDGFIQELAAWKEECSVLQETLIEEIENLPPQEIQDSSTPLYEWYKNLWYRMGGESETSKATGSTNYAQLDDAYMSDSDWLQYALEQGIVSLELVTYDDEGSYDYPNMGYCDWTSVTYSNLTDIDSESNDTAIAKAEVIYENALTEIQSADQEYDLELEELDTEHSAMETEYESMKAIIDENVERSFTAFS